MINISSHFDNINVNYSNGEPALHKPLLIILFLGFCFSKRERLIGFRETDNMLSILFSKFYPAALKNLNTHYPFGKLENDGIWEVEQSSELKRTSAGHLFKGELLEKNIKAGFTTYIYNNLITNEFTITQIADLTLTKYFHLKHHEQLRETVGLMAPQIKQSKIHIYNTQNTPPEFNTLIKISETEMINSIEKINQCSEYESKYNTENQNILQKNNNFIDYLNSLHNLSADGSNALAESQALNTYFGNLYIPFPLAETVKNELCSNDDLVIILTGHAGDGKSTVALDVYKHLNGINPTTSLKHQLKEFETVRYGNHDINIIKDMSELSAEQRINWLDSAFGKPGSWLIISNTGPLLNSFTTLAKKHGIANESWLENEILKRLDIPYENTIKKFSAHVLDIENIHKKVILLNMTRLNNVDIGSQLLGKIINHPSWDECNGCNIINKCPLQVNKNGLKPAHVIDRIRWIYQRLTTYEQHLTMRQIIAHLAFSITGGINCEVAHKHVLSASTKDSHGLGEILFSESFFGYRRGEIHPQAAQLRAIGLIQRLEFGSPFSADFEKKLTSLNTNDWIKLPPDLSAIWSSWQNLACGTSGVRFRFALRRVTYLYGYSQTNMNFAGFINHFLMAPRLCDFDRWQIEKMMTLSHIEMHNFKITILKVLLGIYSGFNAGQFKDDEQKLYLTLRRADKTVVQTTQLVTASFDYDDFSLEYNKATGTPYLIYSKNMAYLQLSLPLLDYIQLTSEGCLGNQLTPIHVAQLERFRSSLIKIKGQKIKNNEEIKLLRAGIDGAVKIHRYVLDKDRNELIQF